MPDTNQFYNELFDELYSQATPGMEEISDTVYPEDVNIAYLHFIDEDEAMQIIEDYCEEYGVEDTFTVKRTVLLGKGPSTSVENVDRAREDAGLEPVSTLLEENR